MTKHRHRSSMAHEKPSAEKEQRPAVFDRNSEHDNTGERIAARAYERYLARGRADGHDLEDWLEAERELRERHERSE